MGPGHLAGPAGHSKVVLHVDDQKGVVVLVHGCLLAVVIVKNLP